MTADVVITVDGYSTARFWAKVDVGRPGVCWLWRAAVNEHGYGVFRLPDTRRNIKAHRMAWRLFNGIELEKDVALLHSCDNPPCVNPNHLVPGTQSENIADMVAKGRQRGRRNSRVLSSVQFEEIVILAGNGTSHADIANRYGISSSYVSMIASGKRGRKEEVA